MYDIIIGIPTVVRPVKNYLLETIESLIKNQSGRYHIKIIIFNGTIDEHNHEVDKIKKLYDMKKSNIEIHHSQKKLYNPKLFTIEELNHKVIHREFVWYNNDKRTYWRSKQCLDFSLLMKICLENEFKIYYHMEDDILMEKNFDIKIMEYYDKIGDKNFLMFGNIGFLGKCFSIKHLKEFVKILEKDFDKKPCDLLLQDYCSQYQVIVGPKNYKHIGYYSSLEGKVQVIT